jgi:DNA-directed RNA polymerase specialized sigma24 family protein
LSETGPRRISWQLSRRAFERFLQALDADPQAGAERYEQLRSKLTRFFEWRACTFPEERADETLNRVIRKIDEGEDIRDPGAYCYAVARLVLLESLKRQAREQEALHEYQRTATIPEEDALEDRLTCLRRCLEALPGAQRDLVREYYRAEGGERFAARQRLASTLGIGMNALRIRAFRLSDKLHACVAACARSASAMKWGADA